MEFYGINVEGTRHARNVHAKLSAFVTSQSLFMLIYDALI